MTNSFKLIFIKTLHTAIWVFYNLVIAYLFYAVTVGNIDVRVWICFGLIAVEGIVLLAFKNICPVTLVARKYSNSTRENFDIYLPNWLAKYNKRIYTAVVLLVIVILIFRSVFNG